MINKNNFSSCQYILFVLLFLIIPLSSVSQNLESGLYGFGDGLKEPISRLHIKKKIDNSYLFYLEASTGEPSFNATVLLSEFNFENNVAYFESEMVCLFKIELVDNGIKLTYVDGSVFCGTANVSGFYNKLNSEIPLTYINGAGKVEMIDSDNDFFTENLKHTKNYFQWNDNVLCTFDGVFDAEKYTISQIEDLYNFILFDYNTFYDFNKLNNNSSLDEELNKINNNFMKKKESINAFKIIKNSDFENYKVLILKELDESKKNQELTLQAFFEPKILLKSNHYEAIKKYADLLNSSDDIIMSYYKDNINKSDNKTVFEVKKHIVYYKLWNELNRTINRVGEEKKPLNAFHKLFLSVDVICDDGPY